MFIKKHWLLKGNKKFLFPFLFIIHILIWGEDLFYSIIGISFIFMMNVLGSLLALLDKKSKYKDLYNGMAAGIMISASFFSLLLPASGFNLKYGWLIITIGFLLGSLMIYFFDKKNKEEKVLYAITIHNIPEGLSVGLAFGLGMYNNNLHELYLALGLAIGIGIQNILETIGLVLILRGKYNQKKSFILSMLSGAVEPFFAIIGLWLSLYINNSLPLFLSIAAGSMIYVVIDELTPENKNGKLGFVIGFIFMMMLDLAF